jgi:hypothetical protein
MGTEKRKIELRFKMLWEYIVVALVWAVFSLWICIRENEILWSILLIAIGLIPLLWVMFISSNVKEFEYTIKTKDIQKKKVITLKKQTAYIFAVLACAIIAVGYYILTFGVLEVKNMGGIVGFSILIAIIAATWKSIIRLSKNKE